MVSLYNKNFKKLLAVPAVFGLLFVIAIFVHPKVTPGIDLVGGTIIRASLEKETDTSKLYDSLLSHFNLIDLQVNTTSGPLGSKVLIQFSYNKELKQAQNFLAQAKQQRETNSQTAVSLALESAKYSQIVLASSDLPPQNPTAGSAIAFAEDQFNKAKESFAKRLDEFLVQELGLLENPKISKGEIGAVLGEKFYSSAITVSVMAFVLLLIVVFVFFRELIPVLAIVAASVFDVAAALALMAVFQIPVSLATIPALLMLIGYSVDTDILLTTRVLKREEKTFVERAHEAMVTGVTMTSTALAAVFVMLLFSYFAQIDVIFQIAAVLFFGLAADLIATWFMNAPMLLWYVERKKKVAL